MPIFFLQDFCTSAGLEPGSSLVGACYDSDLYKGYTTDDFNCAILALPYHCCFPVWRAGLRTCVAHAKHFHRGRSAHQVEQQRGTWQQRHHQWLLGSRAISRHLDPGREGRPEAMLCSPFVKLPYGQPCSSAFSKCMATRVTKASFLPCLPSDSM